MQDRYFFRMIAIATLALVLSGVAYHFRYIKIDPEQQIERFTKTFWKRDQQLREAMEEFIKQMQILRNNENSQEQTVLNLNDAFERKGFAFFMFQNNQLAFWSTSSIPFDRKELGKQEFGVVSLRNGWYSYRKQENPNYTYIALSLIKHEFRYQNRFLVNRFHSDYCIPHEWFFIGSREDEGTPIYDEDQNYLFSVNKRRETGIYESSSLIKSLSVILAIAGLLMIIFYSFRYFSLMYNNGKRWFAVFAFFLVMVVLRLLSFFLKLPEVFYEGPLFSPAFYATSQLLPSLGDLFFNVLLFSILTFFLFVNLRKFSLKGPLNTPGKLILAFSLFVVIYLFCILAVFLIRSLVIDSHLNLDVNFIFNLDMFSLVGFMIIGAIFFSFFFLSVIMFRVVHTLLQNQWRLWGVFLFTLGILILWHWVLAGPGLLEWLLFFAAILVYQMERNSETPQAGFASLIISLFLFSLISSIALYGFNQEKDLEKRKTLALQLASEQDPVAEFMFMDIEETLFNDHQLRNLVITNPYDVAPVYRYLLHHYFYDFWAKYDLQVTICHPHETLLIKPANVEIECAVFFDDYIEHFGRPTISQQFIYLDNNTGRNSYITKIPIHIRDAGEDEIPDYLIFIEFDAKYFARDMGFPELLIDDKIDISRDLINYAYATYKDGMLISKSGLFNFSIDTLVYANFPGEFATFSFDGYHHLLFRKDDHTKIVISRKEESFLEKIAPFSYLFIMFFVMVAVFYMLTSKRSTSEIFRLNFKRRVQVSMITMVVLSVLAIGGASAWFILSISNNKNMSFLRERANSVLMEMEIELDMQQIYRFEENIIPYLSDLLLKQSNVFFTDINLYDINGQLVASSRPKVYEEGLSGNFMNPHAFFTMRNHQINQFIHTEQIGKLAYLSAYVLLRNQYQEELGYINLPYFAKEGELREELSYFFVAFINIYLFLLVVAVLVALFISNFVTRPLQLIRESLSKVQLGKTNQKIAWARNDEIGGLVTEYNRMIDELGASAELLARSERETAWREMAKQVAHEIKNPLTPMRLNIQYLEKAWKENPHEWDERLSRFVKTMIEQIDTLALIAGAFSDFAQMPAKNYKRINLMQFLPEVLNLYNDSEKVEINLDLPPNSEPMWVEGDRNQLIRVINNLINNAIQSYAKGVTAVIDIQCRTEGPHFCVEIKDYGRGIPDELKHRVFSPNFTTKSGGMGLGLSMVKAIVENMGGKVAFHSVEGQGSIFSFKLPLAIYP